MASRHAAVTSRVPVGSEGLEPSPGWLRARYAALTPGSLFGPEEVEPSAGPFKEPDLAVELRANRAGGSRTLALPLKRRIRCHYATAPMESGTYRFQGVATNHLDFSSSSPGRNRTSHRRRIRSPCSCWTTGPCSSP